MLVAVAEVLRKRNRSKNYNRTAPRRKEKDRPGGGGLAWRFAVALLYPQSAGKVMACL